MTPFFRRLACGGTTAVLIAVAAAAPASAAGEPWCEVTGFSPTSVTLGLSEVPVTFRVTARTAPGIELPEGATCGDYWAVVDLWDPENPVTMAAWGLIVAAGLLIGSIPLFVGLAIVMPVLGHATWHLYRRVVEPPHPDDAHPMT